MLENNASVDTKDNYGTTPIIKSLQLLNPIGAQSPNSSAYFDMLVTLPHALETLLSYSTLFNCTVLSTAIETGKSQYVEFVLNLAMRAIESKCENDFSNASMIKLVNQECSILHCPPLSLVTRLIIGIKRPDRLNSLQKRAVDHYELDHLYKIVNMLLTHGARPGCLPHDQLHSPFWLALEFDEHELLQVMLNHGADPSAVFHDLDRANTVSAVQFAVSHGSFNCLELLEQINQDRHCKKE